MQLNWWKAVQLNWWTPVCTVQAGGYCREGRTDRVGTKTTKMPMEVAENHRL